jgi:hypothetical protein
MNIKDLFSDGGSLMKVILRIVFGWLVLSMLPSSDLYATELIFKWGISEDAYELSSNFKQRVTFSLLQENVRSKIENFLIVENMPYRVFKEAEILPCQFSIFIEGDTKKEILAPLLEHGASFFLDDFESAKHEWAKGLEKELSLIGTSKYKDILSRSLGLGQEVTKSELLKLYEKSTKSDLTSYPFLIQSYLEERKDVLPPFCGMGFSSLALREEDKLVIKQFVSNLANKSVLQIIADRESFESTKNRLKVVHPFRFIGFALEDSILRSTLKKLQKSDFKWAFLVAGLERSLKRKKESGALDSFISGFSAYLGIDEFVVRQYIDLDDFKGLMTHLMSFD